METYDILSPNTFHIYIVPFSDKILNNSLLKYRCVSTDLNSALFLVENIFCNIFLCTGMLYDALESRNAILHCISEMFYQITYGMTST